jgi:hypothetical protein
MTAKEHKFLLHMFARQEFIMQRLLDMLKSKVSLTPYEAAAWNVLLGDGEGIEPSYVENMKKRYVEVAKSEGLEVHF